MKTVWRLPVLLSAMLPLSAPASARAPKTHHAAAAKDERARVRELAAKYGVGEDAVRDLRGEGWGWGEVDAALAISAKSGKSLQDVVALRRSGLGWGEIARRYGFTLGDAVRDARSRGRDAERRRDEERRRDADRRRDMDRRFDAGRGRPAESGAGHGRGR
jgi:hypothetical protein